jgi:hypothetical protein
MTSTFQLSFYRVFSAEDDGLVVADDYLRNSDWKRWSISI